MADSKTSSRKPRTKAAGSRSSASSRSNGSSGGGSRRPAASSGSKRATAKSRGSSASKRGSATPVERAAAPVKQAASSAVDRAGSAAGTAKQVADKVKGPAVAVGAAAAGVAGGALLRSRMRPKTVLGVPLPRSRRRVLGIPSRRKSGTLRALEALRDGARHLDSATSEAHELRTQMEKMNNRSPVEVVLDGLTHRRGQR